MEEASTHVCDSLKSARQTAYKAGARGAGLYADMAVVRVMVQRLAKDDPDATTEEEELGYEPSSPKYTPITPPGSPKYVPTTPSQVSIQWGQDAKEEGEEVNGCRYNLLFN